MNRNRNFIRIVYIAILIGCLVFFGMNLDRIRSKTISHQEFIQELYAGNIASVEIYQNRQTPSGRAMLELKDGNGLLSYYVADVNALTQILEEQGIDYIMNDVERESLLSSSMISIILSIGFFVFIIFFVQRQMGAAGGGSKMADFGKSRAKMAMKTEIGFKDVAGLKEEKEDLEEVVDFLKNPAKYVELGARIPKGIILVGPPGTGKTLLAKAVAGEAGVPFFTISGSDFVEMFVGVGASRVRDLFEEAKRNAPCIVFIDEIDAVARKRGSGLGGSHDEREQTLNQMLVEMDGFSVNSGIIVLAATNRVDILDPAILRPGRFDRKIAVGRPDVGGREEILKVHIRKKPIAEDVNIRDIAKTTSGFTGADLENLINEAAILTAKENRKYITRKDIENSFIKVGIGTEKKSKVVSDKEKEITAYHEAGHAILFRELDGVGPVHTISIIPTGMGAAGYTMPMPGEDEMFRTKSGMMNEIIVSLGGRIAEEIIFSDVTTGASQDIRQATAMARAMVTQYGMSDKIGMIHLGNDGDEVFIGRDLGYTKSYSEETAAVIDEEVKHIIDTAYAKAKEIILARKDILDACAKLLIEKEKIGFEEFEELFHDFRSNI